MSCWIFSTQAGVSLSGSGVLAGVSSHFAFEGRRLRFSLTLKVKVVPVITEGLPWTGIMFNTLCGLQLVSLFYKWRNRGPERQS